MASRQDMIDLIGTRGYDLSTWAGGFFWGWIFFG